MSYTIWERISHRHDSIKYIGFDYRGNILKKTISPIFYNDPKRAAILQYIENILSHLVDHIKMIKKSYNWAVPKNYRDFN